MKTFNALREMMRLRNLTQKDLIISTGISQSALTKRFTGEQEFSRLQMYQILDKLELDYEFLPIIFPEDIYESSPEWEISSK